MKKMIEYKITDKLNQERINEILKIESEKGLTAEKLLQEASKKLSPLHDLFEWDDSEAAHLYRLQQARVVINEIKVIIENKEYYAFENVQVAVPNSLVNGIENLDEPPITQRVYKPIVEILSDKDLRNQIISSALRQHEYWERQNEKYSELTPIVKSAKKVREELQKKWQKKK
jgi:hypothetical protein